MTAFIRLMSDGYRIFFMSAGVYAIFAIGVWDLWLSGHWPGTLSIVEPSPLWHAHEMIFGYASAAFAGFFLTAVPSWTGTKAAPMLFIAPVAALWLAGRVAIWFSAILPAELVAVVDLAFLPLLASKIAEQLIRRPKPQNMVFLGFLTAIWTANLMMHLDWMGVTSGLLDRGLRAGLFGLCAMIAVLGGRVTPAFTRNAMKRAGVPETGWPHSRKPVEAATLLCITALPVMMLFRDPDALTGAVAIAGGLLQFLRMSTWKPLWTLNQPILWALHLGMAMLALGLLLYGGSLLGLGSETAALHVLGIGCVGGMTIAVMSRAILGHSGRALIAPGPLAIAYGLVALSALLRWLGADLLARFYNPMMIGAGLLWMFAFVLFMVTLSPAIFGPRGTD